MRADEVVEKNNGTAKIYKYVAAPVGYGGMICLSKVTISDFPPLPDDHHDDGDNEVERHGKFLQIVVVAGASFGSVPTCKN